MLHQGNPWTQNHAMNFPENIYSVFVPSVNLAKSFLLLAGMSVLIHTMMNKQIEFLF